MLKSKCIQKVNFFIYQCTQNQVCIHNFSAVWVDSREAKTNTDINFSRVQEHTPSDFFFNSKISQICFEVYIGQSSPFLKIFLLLFKFLISIPSTMYTCNLQSCHFNITIVRTFSKNTNIHVKLIMVSNCKYIVGFELVSLC